MKAILKSFLFIAVMVMAISSCSKKGGKSGLLIHKDAMFAVHVNGASLSSKLSWDEIKQTYWYSRLNTMTNDTLARQLLDNPEASGLDIKSDFVVYGRKSGKRNIYFTVLYKLKDSKVFGDFLNQVLAKGKFEGPVPSVKTEGEYSWVAIEDQTVIFWNKTYVAIEGQSDDGGFGGDDDFRSFDEGKKTGSVTDSLKFYAKEAIELSPKNNLDGDSRFAAVLEDKGDMHVWINQEKAGNSQIPREVSLMINTDMFLKGNAGGFTVSFENGKIYVKSRNYFSKDLTKLLKKYKSEQIDEAMLNRIPSQNVVAALALNYKPGVIKEFIKASGMEGLVNLGLAQAGISIEEFVKASKGDLLIAATDLTMKKDSLSERMEPEATPVFATSVGDQKAFENFMAALSRQARNESPAGLEKAVYKLDKDWFVMSSTQASVDKFLAGGSGSLAYASQMKGHPMAGFIDLQKALPVLQSETANDSTGMKILEESIKTWQDIVFTGGEWDGDALITEANINLMDKNTNSLKQLNRYVDFVASNMKNRDIFEEPDQVVAEDPRFTPPVIVEEKKAETPKAKLKK